MSKVEQAPKAEEKKEILMEILNSKASSRVMGRVAPKIKRKHLKRKPSPPNPYQRVMFVRSNSRSLSKNGQRSPTPVRPQRQTARGIRKTKGQIERERTSDIEDAVRNKKEVGIEARLVANKGRGIFATKPFKRNDFIVEYSGDLIQSPEMEYREKRYAYNDPSGSSYMYYFKYKDEVYCVDATKDRGRLGRLTNHSRLCNMIPKIWTVDNEPRLLLFAKLDIHPGEELTVDYGDRSKAALQKFEWLRE